MKSIVHKVKKAVITLKKIYHSLYIDYNLRTIQPSF